MKKTVLLFILFFVIAYVLPAIFRPMVMPDEFRYGEIPREMLDNGNFWIPQLLGVRYFEKPHLGYWITAGAIKFFGERAFAVRFMSLLGAALSAFFVFLWFKFAKNDSKGAVLASGIYLLAGLPYALGIFAVLDGFFTAGVTGALVAFYFALQEEHYGLKKVMFSIAGGFAVAVAFLTKGPVGCVVVGLTLVGYIALQQRWREFLLMPWIPLLVFMLVVGPWAYAVHCYDNDFWRYFIQEEHLHRFLNGAQKHPQPWWFFIPGIIGGMFPAAFLGGAITDIDKSKYKQFFRESLFRFAACAVVLPFIFFSLSKGKLMTYIAPCFPALCIIFAGLVLLGLRSGGKLIWFNKILSIWGVIQTFAGILLVILAVSCFFSCIWGLLPSKVRNYYILPWWYFFAIAGVTLLISGIWLWRTKHQNFVWRFIAFGFGFAIVAASSVILPDFYDSKMPGRALRMLKSKFDTENSIIVTNPNVIHALGWEYKRSYAVTFPQRGERRYGDWRARQLKERPGIVNIQELSAIVMDVNRQLPLAYVVRDEDKVPEVIAKFPGCRIFEFTPIKVAYIPSIAKQK